MADITIEQKTSTDGKMLLEGTLRPGSLRDALAGSPRTNIDALFGAIRNRAQAASFSNFEQFVELVFCKESEGKAKGDSKGATHIERERAKTMVYGRVPLIDTNCYHGPDAYNLLKTTAEVFLMLQCGIKVEPPFGKDGQRLDAGSPIEGEQNRETDSLTYEALQRQLVCYLKPNGLPYLNRIVEALKMTEAKSPLCVGLLKWDSCSFPCLLELIWSYWHEEGMLVQTLNALCLRFQNKRGPHAHDPLANLRLDPLRPLNTLMWGYIQDEINRLTVSRRAYEYDHEYGLRLMGKAVADMQTVDSRSKFLEAFHNLLYVTTRFYKEADDTTVRPDAFPVLNALKELHLILAQGAHNQFGDLPWTARAEMLVQKWLLARPEIREFLGGAPMVPYKESWMAHADSMKTLQGWTDVSVTHYRDLGVFGEQILLSVRYADWNSDNVSQADANNWAIYWRPEIQSYIHSYRAVTGVDLSSELTDTRSAADRNLQPAIHQMRRMATNGAQRNGFASRRLTNV